MKYGSRICRGNKYLNLYVVKFINVSQIAYLHFFTEVYLDRRAAAFLEPPLLESRIPDSKNGDSRPFRRNWNHTAVFIAFRHSLHHAIRQGSRP
jgi:hypothetical protein